MIVIVDYGMGNLGSNRNMLKKIGVSALLSSDPAEIGIADKLILPGVGSFDAGMRNLSDRGLLEPLARKVKGDRIPILGICLGMQLMGIKSEEGGLPGLGWLDARRKPLLGGYEVRVRGGREGTGLDPVRHAVRMQEMGAGEILLTSIDRDGTMSGYDLDRVRAVSGAVDVPVIACGGAGSVAHFAGAVQAGASAVVAGAFFVFQGKHRAVLINVPLREELERHLP